MGTVQSRVRAVADRVAALSLEVTGSGASASSSPRRADVARAGVSAAEPGADSSTAVDLGGLPVLLRAHGRVRVDLSEYRLLPIPMSSASDGEAEDDGAEERQVRSDQHDPEENCHGFAHVYPTLAQRARA